MVSHSRLHEQGFQLTIINVLSKNDHSYFYVLWYWFDKIRHTAEDCSFYFVLFFTFKEGWMDVAILILDYMNLLIKRALYKVISKYSNFNSLTFVIFLRLIKIYGWKRPIVDHQTSFTCFISNEISQLIYKVYQWIFACSSCNDQRIRNLPSDSIILKTSKTKLKILTSIYPPACFNGAGWLTK